MKRVWGHFLAGLPLLAGSAVIATACVHDDSSIFVNQVLAPQLVTPGTACTYTSDPTQPYLTQGVLDTAFKQSYTAVFLIANQIIPVGDPTQPDTETSDVVIQGAIIRITDATGVPLNGSKGYTELGTVTIPPAQGNTPSYAAISMTILDQATVASVAVTPGSTRRLLTYTQFFGQTLGGESVETGEFEFPVDVCDGCLITFSASDIDTTLLPKLNCVGASGSQTSSATSSLPVPCALGQDDSIDCSECLSNLTCNPPTVPAP
jgi:hypothetical protein